MRRYILAAIIASLLIHGYASIGWAVNENTGNDSGRQDTEFTDGTTVSSEAIAFNPKTSVVTFENDVSVVNKQFTLKCNKLLITYNKENKPELMQAEGKVRISAANGEAYGCRLKYSVIAGELILEHDARLKQAGKELSSDKMTVMIKNGKIEGVRCEGNARGFVPAYKDN